MSATTKTGILAVDMVGGLLTHYRMFNRPVDEVRLHPKLWQQFRDYWVRKHPEMSDDIDHFSEVQFKNTTVKKGSILQPKDIEWTLKTLTIDPHYNPADFA